MKLGQFEGTMKVYLVKPRGFTSGTLDERIIIDTIGEFDSIEQLNEYLRSSDLSEIRPRRAIALHFEGLAGGRHPTDYAQCLPDCSPIDEEIWDEIRRTTEMIAEMRIEHMENGDFEVESIPFHFWLEVRSPADELIDEGEFINIYRINEYIRSTMGKPEYSGATASLWPMEVVGGICWGRSYGYTLEQYDIITNHISNDIADYVLEMIEKREQYNGYVEEPLSPELYSEPEDYTKKQAIRDEYTYICPFCLHELEDCRCEHYPWTVVQIDTILLPVIRELNEKGYRTAHSCSGHKSGDELMIAFQHEYYYRPIPRGFYYGESSFVLFRPCPEGLSEEAYRAFRQESADALLKWAQELPECPWPDGL